MKLTGSHRSIPSVGVVALIVMIVAVTAACSKPPETAVVVAMPTPAEHTDHSKMDGMSMTGDVDYDFAANMRKHHQMAVDMSKAQLTSGKDPQLLQMANDIIAAQNSEIAVLDQWLEAHKKP